MKGSLADYLKVVTPYLHPDLVTPEALFHIQSLAQTIPSCSLAGFECHLDAEQSRVDFLVQLSRYTLSLPESLLTYPVWQAFREFYQEWLQPSSFLHQGVKNLGLEFDLAEQSSDVKIPSILLDLNAETANEAQGLIKLVTDVYLRLTGYPQSSTLESNLQLCTNSLPDGARIASFGVMLSRPIQALRLLVTGIAPQQVPDYLVRIGWSELTDTLSPLVLSLSKFVSSLVLSFDVSDTIHPKIGLECHLEKQPRSDPSWELLLDYLVTRGLCTPSKQNALLAWPGLSQKADYPEVWPSNLIWGDLVFGSKAFSVFWRTIHEIKIVYQPGRPLLAKAYLAFGHDWLDASTLAIEEQQRTEDSNQTDLAASKSTQVTPAQYLEQVRSYYDRMNPLILKYVGTTYQTSLFVTDAEGNPYRSSNLDCAARSGIQSGDRILDAGCGVCGPSIDIAQTISSVRIDGINLSPVQVSTARELVKQAGLSDQIRVHIGDFHELPFSNESFDVVVFFESIVYSYDLQRLFAEAYRVLCPGGRLYVKGPFVNELPLSKQQQQELEESNKIYVCKMVRMSEAIKAILAVGFQKIISCDLSEIISTKLFNDAMFEYKHGFSFLTE
ncbi:MAG: class I SAM-dependent methyltransferase, partial [Coleofasciculus sp. S288]|nr:class I SAM-dependent methyltransferase [Coleofasciculus sp. S288]